MFHKHSRIFHIHSCDSSNKKNSSVCFVLLPKVETVELLPLSPERTLLGIPTGCYCSGSALGLCATAITLMSIRVNYRNEYLGTFLWHSS